MAMPIADVRKWLSTLSDDSLIYIHDGGLLIEAICPAEDEPNAYLEVGGLTPDPDGTCPSCEVAGARPIIPHGSCDAYCSVCGADWTFEDEDE